MVEINRKEAEMLRKAGFGGYVHMSSKTHKSRSKRYYLTEAKTPMDLLEYYRNNRKILSVYPNGYKGDEKESKKAYAEQNY